MATSKRDKPSVIIVEGRRDVSKYFSETPIFYAYRGPHGVWFKSVAEAVENDSWIRLPPAGVRTVTRRDLLRGGFIRLRDTVVVNGGKCVWCGLCVEKCPTSAVVYREREVVEVRYDKCIDCGLCNSLCPTAAIEMPTLPDKLLAALVKTAPGPLRFVCDYGLQDSEVEGVRVKCIAAIPTQYLYIAASKHGEARAYCSRGESCPMWRAVESWAVGLARVGNEFVAEARKSSLEPGDRWHTRMLAVAVGMPTGVLKVTEECTLCGACVHKCPTRALSTDGRRLVLTPALCTACRVCVDKCPERAITVNNAVVENPYEPLLLFRDNPAVCKSCGRELPYTVTAARKISRRVGSDYVYLCGECRVKSFS